MHKMLSNLNSKRKTFQRKFVLKSGSKQKSTYGFINVFFFWLTGILLTASCWSSGFRIIRFHCFYSKWLRKICWRGIEKSDSNW